MDRTSLRSTYGDLLPGVLLFLSAVPVAYLIYLINQTFPNQPERAAQIVGGAFIFLFILPPAVYLFFKRRSTNPARLALIILATIGVLLVSVYLYRVSYYVKFPADILLWSESDFVNDILKFRLGYPIYTDQANNESFIYTPGSQMMTYLVARLFGAATSIPFYRFIQVSYTFLASIIALFCCRKLIEISQSGRGRVRWSLWGSVCLPILFLLATNSLTNPFVHVLHNDALALLISMTAYWLLLEYISTGDKRLLVVMAILPAAGFFVKQSLAIWAALYCGYLAFFHRPRSLVRVAIFALISFGFIGVVVAVCYMIWGEHFIYWVFTVLGKHPKSILRSFQHIMDVWAYFAIGLIGGLILLRRKTSNPLLGPWLIWLCLFLQEAYTSGVAWMLNHMGPGSLIAGIWFIAAVTRLWLLVFPDKPARFQQRAWFQAGIGVATVALLFSGLGMVRIPVKPLSSDSYRYVQEIEKEFTGESVNSILLDAGTWVYLKEGIVMKDRVLTFGDRGYAGIGDFSGFIQRLRKKHYSKILVRNLHSPELVYDNWIWPKSSGIRQTMLQNYQEIRKIKAVQGSKHNDRPYYFFDEISVLIPRQN